MKKISFTPYGHVLRIVITDVINHIKGELNWLLKTKPGSIVVLEADFLGVNHNPRAPENE